MYDYIKGVNTYKSASSNCYTVTLETGGIGYCLEVLPRDLDSLTEDNKEVKMFTVLIHKEDKMSLCGFLRREDRDMFTILTSVSGVGSKMAFALLNTYSVSDLVNFVIDEDYKAIMQAKGVGQKLAQKIIIELSGKLNSYKDHPDNASAAPDSEIKNASIEEAKMVLLSLGYEKHEIVTALNATVKSLDITSKTEDILKKTLQILSV